MKNLYNESNEKTGVCISMEVKERIYQMQPQMREALMELVKFPSVQGDAQPGAPFGVANAQCLEKALEISKGLGLKTYNMDGYVGWAEYGEGEEMVAVLAHLDVVPEGEGWTVCDPYDPKIIDGKMYGRGTMDDKGPAISVLFGLKALMDEGFIPKRRIRIMFGCNEETGSKDMKYYLEKGGEIPVAGFTPDGNFPLIKGEKGCMNLYLKKEIQQENGWKLLSIQGGTAPNIVPQYAKAELMIPEEMVEEAKSYLKEEKDVHINMNGTLLTIETDGIPAHGSMPQLGENAIGRLCLYMKNLPLHKEAAEAIGFVADKLGMETNGKTLNVNYVDEPSGELTLNLGMISSHEMNGKLSMQIVLDSRCPVTYGYEDLVPVLKEEFSKGGWSVAKESWVNPLYMSDDSEIVQKLLGVYRGITGDFSPALCIGGGTYAKSIPNILAFGPEKQGKDNHVHGADEFIELDQLVESACIYAEAIRALAQ